MSITVNIHEAKTNLSRLLEYVLTGEEVIIARAGKPIARLSPYHLETREDRKPGNDTGLVIISTDFDALLTEING